MDLVDRPRRFRRTAALRRFARETTLDPASFIAPLFVTAGTREKTPIPSMAGHHRWSVDRVGAEAKRLQDLGVGAVILFGLPSAKDATGSSACAADGPVARALAEVMRAAPSLVRIADVCLCEYTEHGHCGVLDRTGASVDNDATLPLLGEAAVAYARAGAHVVAPSAMMDGQVAAIRQALDDAGLPDAAILSYAAKSASAFSNESSSMCSTSSSVSP